MTDDVEKVPTFNGKTKAQIVYDWLAKLRNPDNKQAKGLLKRCDGSRCCLGVLCDAALVPSRMLDHSDECYLFGCAEDTTTLPRSLSNFLGVTHNGHLIREYKIVIDEEEESFGCLTSLNDHAEYSFSQIADVIESGAVQGLEDVKDLLKEIEDAKETKDQGSQAPDGTI